MRNESWPKPGFYPNLFKEVVDNLLDSSLGLKQEDISHNNIEDIYLFIVNNIELNNSDIDTDDEWNSFLLNKISVLTLMEAIIL